MNYFELFGLSPEYPVNDGALRRRFRELQREAHPDRVAHLDEKTRLAAVRQSAMVNDAYETLRHPVKRAHYLLTDAGFALPDESRTFGDTAFLMEQMALREALADAQEARDNDALLALRQQVSQSVSHHEDTLGALFAQTPWNVEQIIDESRRLTFFLKLDDELANAQEALAF